MNAHRMTTAEAVEVTFNKLHEIPTDKINISNWNRACDIINYMHEFGAGTIKELAEEYLLNHYKAYGNLDAEMPGDITYNDWVDAKHEVSTDLCRRLFEGVTDCEHCGQIGCALRQADIVYACRFYDPISNCYGCDRDCKYAKPAVVQHSKARTLGYFSQFHKLTDDSNFKDYMHQYVQLMDQVCELECIEH